MKTEKLIDQLELYSNAIVGFMVAQSIVFSLAFGTSPSFGCEVTNYKSLAAGLAVHFTLATVLAGVAIMYLKRRMIELSNENADVIRTVFLAKVLVIVAFTIIPVALVSAFGFLAQPGIGRCAAVSAPQR
jgi:hypothetical protein